MPPIVQAGMATQAARAGKHLLLDKPIALDVASADALESAVEASGVASVVFFTDRFVDTSRAWFDRVRKTPGWRGAWYRWLSTLQAPDNPFGGSAWRRERGALWDTGPHALSTLIAALGPVAAIRAVAGDDDLVTLVVRHESGSTSTAVLSQFAPPAAASFDCTLWGDAGLSPMPQRPDDRIIDIYATAASELVAAAVTPPTIRRRCSTRRRHHPTARRRAAADRSAVAGERPNEDGRSGRRFRASPTEQPVRFRSA